MNEEPLDPSTEAVEWAKALIAEPLTEEVTMELIRLVERGSDDRAHMAAWALAFGEIPAGLKIQTVRSLLAVVAEPARPGIVREYAAEAVAEQLEFSDRSDPDRHFAEALFVEMLSDPAPGVRFWSAFALNKLRTVAALPRLRELTSDKTLVSGWWTVGEEASDAIDCIEGRQPPERQMSRGTPQG